MIKLGAVKKFIAILANFSLFFNSLVPFLLVAQPAYAQEASSVETIVTVTEAAPTEVPVLGTTNEIIPEITPEVTVTPEVTITPEITPTPEVTPTLELIPTPELTPTDVPITTEVGTLTPPVETITPTPETISTVSITPTPSSWTFEKVELNKEYVAPQNNQVKLTFTKLPENPGNLKIEEITLTPEQITQTGSVSDKAYNITSDMVDGTFAYNLSLPIPESSKGKAVDVKFTEEISKIDSAQKVDNSTAKTEISISVENLNHFTIFVVSNPVLTGSACVTAGATAETNCYLTIQAAITASVNGDTINVAAGTYTEHLTINKQISLLGADKNTTIIDGSGTGTVITVTSNGVNIEGFTIRNSGIGAGDRGGIYLQGVNGCDIKNNIITNNFVGVGLVAATSNTVENNTLTDNYFGVYVGTNENHSTGNTITGNDISTTKYLNLGSIKTGDGIYADQDCNNNTFTNNNVHNNEKNGIYFWKSTTNTATGNTVTNNAASGFELQGSSDNIITGNTITGNKDGFHIRNSAEAGYSITGNIISSNKVYDNSRVNLYTDANQDTNFKAENNWWGSATESEIIAKMAGYGFDLNSTTNTTPGTLQYIDYSPWCANNACSSFAPVTLNHSGVKTGYSTIQSAITASVNGDIINVAAGTYEEHLTINKQITLVGADKTTTIIDGTDTGVVVTITASNVTLKNFTIKNSGTNITTDAGIGLVGVSGVTVKDNIITNNVTGIAVMSSSGNTITDNTISNSARYGIVLEEYPYVPGVFSTSNTISGNTMTANARDGIYVGKDCNSNTINDNTISGATGTTEINDKGSSIFEANGIYFWKSANNTVTGNTISSNTLGYGIEIYGSKSNTITDNEITGNKDGFHIRNINEETYPGYSIRDNNISNNKIYGNNRVNLYGSPNFDFDIENNWWGSADRATIVSKLASWDASGDVVLGTTVYLDFDPWYIDPSKTTLSSDIDTIFDNVAASLASNGIASNIGDVTASNYTSFPNLYFEKSINGVKMGKITFTSELDLSKDETKTFLQNLGTKMDMTETGVISLDFRGTTDSVALKGKSAKIEFYGLDKLGFTSNSTSDEVNSKLVAYDDNGNILNKSDLVNSPGVYTPPVGACEVGGACYIFSVDVNHFTKYKIDEATQTTNSSSNNDGGSTSASAPVCNDSKPGSAPVLLSVVAGVNSVTLSWSKSTNPVSYYLVAYGTKSGSMEYGNPNVGNSDTTSYTIKGLSGGTTYYFKVRAGNGCMPGDFSNELSARPSGVFIETSATGFEPNVLGETTTESNINTTPTAAPTPAIELGNILGSSKNKEFSNWWWLLLLGIIPLYVVGKKISKKK